MAKKPEHVFEHAPVCEDSSKLRVVQLPFGRYPYRSMNHRHSGKGVYLALERQTTRPNEWGEEVECWTTLESAWVPARDGTFDPELTNTMGRKGAFPVVPPKPEDVATAFHGLRNKGVEWLIDEFRPTIKLSEGSSWREARWYDHEAHEWKTTALHRIPDSVVASWIEEDREKFEAAERANTREHYPPYMW